MLSWLEGLNWARSLAVRTVGRLDGDNEAIWAFDEVRIQMALNVGSLAEARGLYSHVARLRPNDAPVHLLVAAVGERLGDATLARQGYQRVLQLWPGHPAASEGLRRLQANPGPR